MLSRTAVIVLAAGLSRRFGVDDKLMAALNGKPLIAHCLDIVRGLEVGQRIVVTGPHSDFDALAEGFETVRNPAPQKGMASSIASGVAAVRQDMTGAFITLGDMPFVTADAYSALAQGDGDIVVPVYGGQPGHPVLFRRACFEDLGRLTGDVGARSLIESGRYEVVRIDITGKGGLIDIDRPEDLPED